MARGQNAPSGSELTTEIAKIVEASGRDIAPSELQAKLAKSHPEWKLPERRVNKFLKRHLNGVQSGKGFLGLFAGRKSQKKTGKDLAMPESAPDPKPAPPTPVETPEEPKEAQTDGSLEEGIQDESRSLAYGTDDNNGSKNDCQCETCTVM